MLAFMDICMGGRVAEEIVYGAENVTSGRTCTPSLPLHCDAFFFSVTTSSYTLCSPTHSLHSHSTPSPSTSSPLHKPRFMVTSKAELEDKLLEGIAELDRGEGLPGEQVFAELKAQSAKRRRRHV